MKKILKSLILLSCIFIISLSISKRFDDKDNDTIYLCTRITWNIHNVNYLYE